MNDQLYAALFGAGFGLFGAVLGRPLFAYILSRIFRDPASQANADDIVPNINMVLCRSNTGAASDADLIDDQNATNGPVYEGVYVGNTPMEKCTSRPQAEDIDRLVNSTRDYLTAVLESSAPQSFEHSHVGNLLCMIASGMKEPKKKIVVFDFGGKTGLTFIHLLSTAPWAADALEYFVIEKPNFVDRMQTGSFYQEHGLNNIHFVRSVDEIASGIKPDIIYFPSSLQAMDDYKAMIKTSLALAPQHILITHTPMGLNTPTFSTYQIKFPPSPVKHWMINFNDVVEDFTKDSPYDLTYQLHATSDVLTFEEFPPAYQDIRITHMMFSRSNTANAKMRRKV